MNVRHRARRHFLKFLAGSPLLYPVALTARAWQSPALLADPLIVSADQAVNVFDFEAVAREKLPVAHYGFLATGSDGDGTVQANREGFGRFQLRVRMLIDVRQVDMSMSMFGGTWPTPIVLAPVGNQRAFDARESWRETDIFKALALGPSAVMIGRPYIWGLAAFGQSGVESVCKPAQGTTDRDEASRHGSPRRHQPFVRDRSLQDLRWMMRTSSRRTGHAQVRACTRQLSARDTAPDRGALRALRGREVVQRARGIPHSECF